MGDNIIIGVDLAQSVFQLHGATCDLPALRLLR